MLMIPAQPCSGNTPDESDDLAPAARTPHGVIVVDDDGSFARTVADALADSDIEAIAVSDPREALDLVQQRRYAAAVVDLIMPDMDGLELARELRRASPATEIVMLTGHADMHSAIEAIRHDLFDYLRKDELQSVRLRRAVRAAIARSELREENRRLLAGLQASARKLKVLSEISTRLAAEQHLDRLLAELTAAARDLLEADAVRVVLTEINEYGDVTIRVAQGDGRVAPGTRFGPGDGIVARVLETGTPVRIDVAADHPNYSSRCDDMGSTLPGFLCVPLLRPTLSGALTVAGRARPFTGEDLAILASLARQGAVAVENARVTETNRNFFTHASEMLVALLDAKDVHYEGHSHAVAALTDMVTRRLGLPEDERRSLHFAALLHDVGKLRIRGGVLSSGAPVTEEQREAIRMHPALGVEILRPISMWGALAPAIHTHHERWDGKGYPRGLTGAEIPIGGRIIAVAEAFEAMTRVTPHKPARSADEALAEIEACAGTQFDPTIARLFCEEYWQNMERFAVPAGR